MPQITFKGVPEHVMQQICGPVYEQLAAVIGCPPEWLVVERTAMTNYGPDGPVAHCPTVDVSWFSRPQETRDRTAEALRDILRGVGYKRVLVQIHETDKAGYYDFTE